MEDEKTRTREVSGLSGLFTLARRAAGLGMRARLLRVRGNGLRGEYVRRFWRAFRARRSPVVSRPTRSNARVHYHLWHFAQALQATHRQQLMNTF